MELDQAHEPPCLGVQLLCQVVHTVIANINIITIDIAAGIGHGVVDMFVVAKEMANALADVDNSKVRPRIK